jgi:light-regulated signal transduction histidine kinase (bacteriophytochrome)
MERVDLSRTLTEVTNDLEISISDRRARIISQALPTVRANALQMHQLFQNLIANAIKFSRQDPEVRIEVEESPFEWKISVSDNGIGIEAPYRERIFNVFSRLHNRTEYPGTGIGLAICKKIVEVHGGKIWVEESSSGGSKFTFTLAKKPVVLAKPSEAPLTHSEPMPPMTALAPIL